MGVESAVNIEDLHQMAKRRLPRVAFEFIEGGVEDERCLDRNTEAFKKHQLVPRYLVDVSKRDQTQTLFGKTYNSPFGIAPTGAAGLFRRGADMMLARAALAANIPYIMSGASNDSIETAAKVAPNHAWYQLYGARDAAITDDMIKRTADAGLEALVLTVDVPVRPKRERSQRNGSLKPKILAEAITHPGWVWEYVTNGGMPMLENWAKYAKPGATATDVNENNRTLLPAHGQTWNDLERYRRLFPRQLVVKGIMHPADAIRCAELGCDGIIVSNHGARQLDQAPSPLDVLPAIKEALGDRLTIMLDSGVRRGADALIALCLGAQFVFTGRATLYGAVAGGEAGVNKAIDIVRGEIDLVMGQIGCPSLDKLGPDFLWPAAWPRNA
jgi:(S)-mandelate dehydrogenase